MRAAAIPQSGNILYCGVRILPGEQPGEYEDEKLEIMVLELKKLPPEAQSEEGVVRWMRFLSGKGKEDLAEMAEKDLYLKEAYEELERLSMDEEKRYAYEAREKALRDHISMMNYAMEKGLQEVRDKGYAEGRDKG